MATCGTVRKSQLRDSSIEHEYLTSLQPLAHVRQSPFRISLPDAFFFS